MILKTRSVAISTAAFGLLGLGLLGWQIASKEPSGKPAQSAEVTSTSASGVVTRRAEATAGPPASASVTLPPPVVVTAASAPSARASIASKPAANSVAEPALTASVPIKHRVASRPASQPPILPNEVNRVVGQALGANNLARYLYLDPLIRRFVASVDGMGQQAAPKTLWLLKPAPGTLKLSDAKGTPPVPSVASTNSRRYAGFVRWFESTDTRKLVSLYARMYPLLQQTYVELGHPDGYFNDRVIEVIDQLLATPVVKAPLRVKQVNPEAETESSTPQRPRYELITPELEQLTTGQKMLLRTGPQQAARLKVKLKDLRRALITLSRPL